MIFKYARALLPTTAALTLALVPEAYAQERRVHEKTPHKASVERYATPEGRCKIYESAWTGAKIQECNQSLNDTKRLITVTANGTMEFFLVYDNKNLVQRGIVSRQADKRISDFVPLHDPDTEQYQEKHTSFAAKVIKPKNRIQ